ncbi:MAG: DHH family phosphoesterase [SAR324 cluster bacterium]|nr:DHH family phosphoesterase [SAR324 cluster bacterium]
MRNSQESYFIFNGDADGLCAAHQIQLSGVPCKKVITGVKRDISLLKQIADAHEQQLFVFDIAVEKNLAELKILLQKKCKITWFDHHVSEEIPTSPLFTNHIDTDPNTNTSMLVNQALKGKFAKWAVVGLFGDNLHQSAELLAQELKISAGDTETFKELGTLLNYNAYGSDFSDIYFHPEELFKQMKPFAEPLDFVKGTNILESLRAGFAEDLKKAKKVEAIAKGIYIFPNEKWARRVIGVYANQLVSESPDSAMALLIGKGDASSGDETYLISVRAPINGTLSAAALCKKFPTGGGRIKAAGINQLPKAQLGDFVEAFSNYFVVE